MVDQMSVQQELEKSMFSDLALVFQECLAMALSESPGVGI
jgi:hypothetical protein